MAQACMSTIPPFLPRNFPDFFSIRFREANCLLFSDLYVGKNGNGQNVLTWYSTKTADKFHGDLAPLVNRLVKLGKTNFPEDSDYIGYMSLGTETYSSDEYVTFHVPELSIDVSTK